MSEEPPGAPKPQIKLASKKKRTVYHIKGKPHAHVPVKKTEASAPAPAVEAPSPPAPEVEEFTPPEPAAPQPAEVAAEPIEERYEAIEEGSLELRYTLVED